MFLIYTSLIRSFSTFPKVEIAEDSASKSFSRMQGIRPCSGDMEEMLFNAVFLRSMDSKTRRVVRSARPIPIALPWDSGVSPKTTIRLIFGVSGSV
ncbi:hypothetical protein SPFL3101_02836 [Sporomusaceae bacterium FL31]|nr:hypothetical protein SPFL3101_02836 [Sporomusaceae bacterium FL31]